jgi:hypothetical protein
VPEQGNRKIKVPKSHPLRVKNVNLSTTASAGEKEFSHFKKELPEIDDTYRRIEALKQSKPSPAKNTDLFHYDPNEPLHLPK